YQGQFTLKDEETGLDAFELRLWDSRLARWTSTDPYGQYASPYLGMGNNPISGVDPDGGLAAGWTSLIGAGVGAGVGYAATGTWEGALGGALIGASVGYGFGGSGSGGSAGGSGNGGYFDTGQLTGYQATKSATSVAKGFDAGFAISNTISTLSTTVNAIQQGNTIRQNSTVPGSVKTNNFNISRKSKFRFSNLSHSDNVEVLDQNGNVIMDVKSGNPNANETFPNQSGTYFRFSRTLTADDIFKEVGRKVTQIQIRVTGNPSEPTKWSYQFYDATEISLPRQRSPQMQRYKSVRFL
ncbi:MAG: hypothetical protein CMH30_05710, partial [Micavibrio sp.]|nr:hypothetical protein [Micavibrio sp.]